MSAELALELLDRSGVATQGLWARAAAVLGRQALEAKILSLIADGFADCSMRAQLLVLEERVGRTRAGELAFVYGSLSEACHYHPYQPDPVACELRGWIGMAQ